MPATAAVLIYLRSTNRILIVISAKFIVALRTLNPHLYIQSDGPLKFHILSTMPFGSVWRLLARLKKIIGTNTPGCKKHQKPETVKCSHDTHTNTQTHRTPSMIYPYNHALSISLSQLYGFGTKTFSFFSHCRPNTKTDVTFRKSAPPDLRLCSSIAYGGVVSVCLQANL